MPPREDLILFLDLETTGSDVANDEIIEIGLSMIETEGLTEVGSFSKVYIPSEKGFARMTTKKVVYDMHKLNGLYDEILADIQRIHINNSDYASHSPSYSADKEVVPWLKNFVGEDTTHIPFGGSGVSHFDRKFLDKYMASFAQRLTYWSYDVGPTRRMFEKIGLPWIEDAKTHRALDDARHHADEFRYAMSYFKGEVNA